MEKTFFFYDLETSGRFPSKDRIMQFAGQRADMNLDLVGDPVNILVKLPNDTLPSPIAISITGITPQSTQSGLSEADFCGYVTREIFTQNTIAVGYNSIRFDDEFMRYCFWRNFYDPYEWQWKDGREKWDLLDVVRLTRALRPEGINWPIDKNGKATNRLELLTKANSISHESAHDALSDVIALINVTRLIKEKQPKIFDFLLKIRNKNEVLKYVDINNPRPFVYTSGRYKSEFNKTTVAYPLTASKTGILVYDLRYNFAEVKKEREEKGALSLFPVVKELKPNRCPAIAPIAVLEQNDGWNKIGLSEELIESNLKILKKNIDSVLEIVQATDMTKEFSSEGLEVESKLYDGFLNDSDKSACRQVRNMSQYDLALSTPYFIDDKLHDLYIHYKGRNFPETMSDSEKNSYENYRKTRILEQERDFSKELTELKDESLVNILKEWRHQISP